MSFCTFMNMDRCRLRMITRKNNKMCSKLRKMVKFKNGDLSINVYYLHDMIM